MVAEDGREFYRVSNEFDTRRVAKNNWLMDNVMSSIPHDKFVVQDFEGARVVRDIHVKDGYSKKQIAADLYDFLSDGEDIKLWAWYSAYDHVCLAQLFGTMLQLPNGVPMYTSDIRTLVDLAGGLRVPAQPEGLHNALADAKYNVVRYNYLMEVLRA